MFDVSMAGKFVRFICNICKLLEDWHFCSYTKTRRQQGPDIASLIQNAKVLKAHQGSCAPIFAGIYAMPIYMLARSPKSVAPRLEQRFEVRAVDVNFGNITVTGHHALYPNIALARFFRCTYPRQFYHFARVGCRTFDV